MERARAVFSLSTVSHLPLRFLAHPPPPTLSRALAAALLGSRRAKECSDARRVSVSCAPHAGCMGGARRLYGLWVWRFPASGARPARARCTPPGHPSPLRYKK